MSQTQPPNPARADILLESGTNELEVLIFRLGGQAYGVNVAKVREVITPQRLAASPAQPPCVRGMFNLRGHILPLVDLNHYLAIDPAVTDRAQHKVIVTEFNGVQAAFEVEGVEHIHRMSWSDMKPVPEAHGQHHWSVTGITEIAGRLIMMLDFESIFDHISLQDNLHVDEVENELGVDRSSARVVLAEDSRFILELMQNVLTRSGYRDVRVFNNGKSAWDWLAEAGKDPTHRPSIVVTDIEMPGMDGLALTRRIKADAALSGVPVILFSSLITDDTRHKGKAVGADDQIAKPELPKLVRIVDRWLAAGVSEAAA